MTADASDGGKLDAPVDPDEQEISKQMEPLKVRMEHRAIGALALFDNFKWIIIREATNLTW